MVDRNVRGPLRPSSPPPSRAPHRPSGGGDADAEEAAPDSSPSTRLLGEDFLYHLYRGSELLQDNCVTEAKEELERALAVRPRDLEGQGLLGVVYFRLGLYPRAIEIYEELLRSFPEEVTPRLNLALSCLKTGQQHRARELLEGVVARAPEHRRAWGYLGLVLERLGELRQAEVAFERAGQSAMAGRMRARLESSCADPTAPSSHGSASVRQAAADAVAELELDLNPFAPAETADRARPSWPVGRWRAVEPGLDPALCGTNATNPLRASAAALPSAQPSPSTPLAGGTEHAASPSRAGPSSAPDPISISAPRGCACSPAEFARHRSLSLPDQGGAVQPSRVASLRVEDAVVVRSGAVRALFPDSAHFRSVPAYRHNPVGKAERHLGAEGCFDQLTGQGFVILAASSPEARLLLLQLVADEPLYVRGSRLVAFTADLRHEAGRLARGSAGHYPMLQLSGEGTVVLELEGELRTARVGPQRPLAVVAEGVFGWIGRLFAQALAPAQSPSASSGFVEFSGDGAVFLSFP